jgi:hypothetical protein
MKRVLQILRVFFLLFGVKTVLHFYQLLRLLLEKRYELFYLLFAAHQTPDFAAPLRYLLVCLDCQFYGRHVLVGNQTETVDHLQKGLFALFYGCGVRGFFLDHFKVPSSIKWVHGEGDFLEKTKNEIGGYFEAELQLSDETVLDLLRGALVGAIGSGKLRGLLFLHFLVGKGGRLGSFGFFFKKTQYNTRNYVDFWFIAKLDK